ncbi:MAG: L-aspartate oxidase [Desulfovibrio sp.]|uniref:L-aspartate oxidase n=1 Tax=Desulfovibrio sp. 7SRBS1 TaxID=3378064 RepID=UPI003B3D49B3
MTSLRLTTRVLVIGSGIAGATCALQLAEAGNEVTLLTAAECLTHNNSSLAQGGIIYTAGPGDEKQLINDILTAGWRQNYKKAVRLIAQQGPQVVKDILISKIGVPFHKNPDGSWNMTREGGHSQKRILHCADFTGRAIMEGLAKAVENSPNIRILYNRTAIDLITTHHKSTDLDLIYNLVNQCVGAYVYNDTNHSVETILADYTVMASGGAGQIYLHTTNTKDSIGSGLAMGGRAGAVTRNAEFVQFHPTVFYHKSKQSFLISEAVRGEGAKLVNAAGEAFMPRYDSRADLAPRDIVTRAIQEEMLHTGEPCVFLDAANYVKQDIAERFPTIFNHCLQLGLDIRKNPIPVVPAAHYFCGGLLTDMKGHTSLERLYAVGECACTGVHGANRLASTSLLEGVLWGYNAAEDIASKKARSVLSRKILNSIPDWESPGDNNNEDPALIAQDWAAIRHTMWNYVGITRSSVRLKRALSDLRNQYKHLQQLYSETRISKQLVDLFHGSQAAYVITMAAMRNRNSQGCHYRIS